LEERIKTSVTRQSNVALQLVSSAARLAESMTDQTLAEDLHQVEQDLNKILRAAERRRYVGQMRLSC